MTSRVFQLYLSVFILSFLFCGHVYANPELPTYNVGTVMDGSTPDDKETLALFKRELRALAEGEFVLMFPESMTLSGNGSAQATREALDQLLANPDVDLILPLGPIGSTAAFNHGNLAKPVIAPFVVDKNPDKVDIVDGSSGIKNLAYIDATLFMDREITNFKKIAPFSNLAILLDRRILTGLPEITEYVKKLASKHSLNISLVPAGKSVTEAVAAIPSVTDAVMVGMLYNFSATDYEQLSQGLIKRSLPSYAIWSYFQMEHGILAGEIPQEMLANLARRVAVSTQDILLGEAPDTLPMNFSRGKKLTINMATARALGIYPSLDLSIGANLLNEQRTDISRHLNLPQAINEALKENLKLTASRINVTAGEYAVSEARSPLLPQIGLSTGLRAIDSDRAKLGQGSTPEQAWTGTATGSQQIYSDRRWAAYTVAEFKQTGRTMALETVRLNTIYKAAVAYLNVLRAKTIEQLVKDNLKLTQANLDRARIRVSIGVASPDEEYRWEVKVATNKSDVLASESITLDAMAAVNRILNRPLQELFVAEEANLDDPLLMVGGKFFQHLTSHPKYFHIFRDFAIAEALDWRPELKSLDASIAAQKRLETAAGREIWLPDFSLEGSVDQYINQSGVGQRNESVTGLDNTDWQIGVFARLPLFEGGRRISSLNRNRQKLLRLQVNRRDAAYQISQDTLVALNRTRASFPGISLSRQAADAAGRNLTLITDSYTEGIKSIIELLDAQNQALSANQAAANAVYNFLIDMMGVQRAMGEFITFLPQDQQDTWMQRVRDYLENPPVAGATAAQ
jgi:outer membrane protein TolC/ABC-type uncharacterized transport system substrate-binding protein